MMLKSLKLQVSMGQFSCTKRQLLFYLGLGIASATTAKALGTTTKVIQTPSMNLKEPELISLSTPSNKIPEFVDITNWLNSTPQTVDALKGNVVLVQFWTFACINCQRTLPYIVQWHRKYAASGLKVIGIHTPEFAYEREINNIKRAVKRHEISYPVGIDNQYKTWENYKNEYWPHLFLADRQGFLRYDHIGEGAYDTTEKTIIKLLG